MVFGLNFLHCPPVEPDLLLFGVGGHVLGLDKLPRLRLAHRSHHLLHPQLLPLLGLNHHDRLPVWPQLPLGGLDQFVSHPEYPKCYLIEGFICFGYDSLLGCEMLDEIRGGRFSWFKWFRILFIKAVVKN